MKIGPSSTLTEVAFIVGTAMAENGVTVVLCGGGAAAFYAPKAYKTNDLDFVIQFSTAQPKLQVIVDLGYRATRTRGVYEHPQSPFTLEFLDGPLAVADEELTGFETIHRDGLQLNVIRSIDCIKDRLAAGIFWNDPNAAKQAAAVAKQRPVDLELIEAWCVSQDPSRGMRTFNIFRALLTNSRVV